MFAACMDSSGILLLVLLYHEGKYLAERISKMILVKHTFKENEKCKQEIIWNFQTIAPCQLQQEISDTKTRTLSPPKPIWKMNRCAYIPFFVVQAICTKRNSSLN
jgi:hypothetical protein